ncbi:hypothetical protein JCM12298_01110 [Desulfothermus naphthae]
MQILKKIINKMITLVASIFLKEKICIGKDIYMRRLLLPNLMSKTLHHEEFLDDIYRAALKKNEGAIIDVGVNTGQTLLKILSFDKNRLYFGFEPQSTAASCVESFLIENKIKNYCILPIALSDKNECVLLHIRGNGVYSMASDVASMIDGFRPANFYNYKKYIYAARGDEVIDSLGIPSIALIKVDVEGAELEVIKGLKMTIDKHRPFILFEVLHHYLVVTKEKLDKESIDFRELRIQELEEILRTKKYHIYPMSQERCRVSEIRKGFFS